MNRLLNTVSCSRLSRSLHADNTSIFYFSAEGGTLMQRPHQLPRAARKIATPVMVEAYSGHETRHAHLYIVGTSLLAM